jgi:hypothetical protein
VQPDHRRIDPKLEPVPGDEHHQVARLLQAATRKRIWADLDAGHDPDHAREAAGLPKELPPEPVPAEAAAVMPASAEETT